MRTWIIGILAFFVWSTGCTYWYVCQVKGLCPDGFALFGSSDSSGEAATVKVEPEASDSGKPIASTDVPVDTLGLGTEVSDGNEAVPPSLLEPMTVLFAFAGPQTESRDVLEAYLETLATYLKANPQQKALVRGYTDDTAARENNLKLAQRRCDVIVAMLGERGVAEGQIVTEPMGEADPVATNDTPEGRRLNRRVVISLQQ